MNEKEKEYIEAKINSIKNVLTQMEKEILSKIEIDRLINWLPSIIWIDSFPCELRITRDEAVYYVTYTESDECDDAIRAKGNTLTEAIINMLMELKEGSEYYMLTYEDEKAGNKGHQQTFEMF